MAHAKLLTMLSAAALTLTLRGDEASKPAIGKFTLVYNVNNSGYIDVCGCKEKKVRNGSLTRRSSYLKQLRSTGRTLLLLDGGSTLFDITDKPSAIQREEAVGKAKIIIEAYNRMGYRAMAVGVSDLLMGLEVMKELLSRAQFDVLSANFFDKASGKLLFKPHAIYEAGGVRVGVIGLTLETMGSAYIEKVAPGVEIRDPLEAAKRSVAELKGKTDLIIALSHLKQESNYRLLSELGEIGLVVDPYIEHQSHRTWIKEEEWLGELNEGLFLRSDGQGARLGVIDITVDHSGAKLKHQAIRAQLEASVAGGAATDAEKAELASFRKKNIYDFERVSILPHHREDPDIDILIDEWKKGFDPSKAAHLEKDLPMRDSYLTKTKCRACHEPQYEFWATTPHAQAMASLEKTSDQHRYDCVGCHSLGFGTAYLDTSNIGAYADVQCESCHGALPGHAEDPKKHRFAALTEFTCLVCHNKEHTLKDFDFVRSRAKVGCQNAKASGK
jgi:2',3'-cyclic-nucleotide 2'-phosphodiesterase (5'-nucleotidase family)